MIIRKAFKFRLKPNKKQVKKFFQFAQGADKILQETELSKPTVQRCLMEST